MADSLAVDRAGAVDVPNPRCDVQCNLQARMVEAPFAWKFLGNSVDSGEIAQTLRLTA